MVVTTGDITYQTGEFGLLDDTAKDWENPMPATSAEQTEEPPVQEPLPALYFEPKVRDSHPRSTMARYRHRGGHRAKSRNRVQWFKHMSIRFIVLTFAVYYYFAVTVALKGTEAATVLFWLDTAVACTSLAFRCGYIALSRHEARKKVRQQMAQFAMAARWDGKGRLFAGWEEINESRTRNAG